MLWYYKNKNTYLYPSKEEYSDEFTNLTYRKHYEHSEEDSIIPSLLYMRNNSITDAACVVPIEELSVNYGRQEDIDFDYCEEHFIPTFYINRSGGAMVLFPGNIAIDAICTTVTNQMEFDFLSAFKHWLVDKDIEAYLSGNDLMIRDKKVVGAVGDVLPEPFQGYTYMGFSISINCDAELIDKICTKPMGKIPGALSDYGITTEEVTDFVLQWLNEHLYEHKDEEQI